MKHGGAHGNHQPVSLSFAQVMGRIVRSVDSFPLLAALGTAATMLSGFIVYQFAVRPDFKAYRISSNATSGIDKPIGYHSNRIIWLGKRTDDTPKEVKELVKSLRD